jgi:nucleotide-binding universal stress UspA family protein
MTKPIVHPTDFSPASRPAFRAAMTLAKRMRRPLVIAHVLAPPVIMMEDAYMPRRVWEQLEQSQRAAAQKQIDRLIRAARANGIRTTSVLLEGVSHEQISRAARGRRAEMIVMGTHGRTGLKRLMLGSVAARVLATAQCPVLTVRAA